MDPESAFHYPAVTGCDACRLFWKDFTVLWNFYAADAGMQEMLGRMVSGYIAHYEKEHRKDYGHGEIQAGNEKPS